MELRKYKHSDCETLAELFHQTVHTVNAKDYTEEQLNAWSSGSVNLREWDKSFTENKTIIAAENGVIIGFGDMDESAYLNRLYVHKSHQGRGIASAICDELERFARGKRITVHASVTAKPFFRHRGYYVIRKQEVIRRGIALTNYIMKKEV